MTGPTIGSYSDDASSVHTAQCVCAVRKLEGPRAPHDLRLVERKLPAAVVADKHHGNATTVFVELRAV